MKIKEHKLIILFINKSQLKIWNNLILLTKQLDSMKNQLNNIKMYMKQ